MAWGNFLKKALPVAAGIFGSPALGAAVGAGLSLIGSGREAGQINAAGQQAADAAQQGYNFLNNSVVGTQYLPAGAAANAQTAGLLGVGGDPAAAAAGYQNYLNSVGFQGQLDAGTDALTSSAAASGALGSGATLKALQSYGTQLGRQNFGNYLAQLQGLSQQGLQAGGMIGQAAQGAGMAGAQYLYGAGTNAAGARAEGFNQFAGGLGGVFEGIQGAIRGKVPSVLSMGGKTAPELNVLNKFRGYA